MSTEEGKRKKIDERDELFEKDKKIVESLQI